MRFFVQLIFHDPVKPFAGDFANDDCFCIGDSARFADFHGERGGIGQGIVGAFLPLFFKSFSSPAGMFRAEPFGFHVGKRDLIIDAQCFRVVVRRSAFRVNAVVNTVDLPFGIDDLAGQDSFVRCRGVMRLFFRWREHIAAFRTGRDRRVYDQMTLRTFFRGSRAAAFRFFVGDDDGVDWPVPKDIAAVIEYERVGL